MNRFILSLVLLSFCGCNRTKESDVQKLPSDTVRSANAGNTPEAGRLDAVSSEGAIHEYATFLLNPESRRLDWNRMDSLARIWPVLKFAHRDSVPPEGSGREFHFGSFASHERRLDLLLSYDPATDSLLFGDGMDCMAGRSTYPSIRATLEATLGPVQDTAQGSSAMVWNLPAYSLSIGLQSPDTTCYGISVSASSLSAAEE